MAVGVGGVIAENRNALLVALLIVLILMLVVAWGVFALEVETGKP